jgi:hemoglobin
MVTRFLAVAALAGAVLAFTPAAAGAQDAPPAMTLYKQLGGYDAIAAVTDDLLARLTADPKLAKFFVGLNDQHKAVLRQRFVDFLCFKTGGPCVYTGADMKTAHAGLGITEDEWNAAIADFGKTEDKFDLPQPLRTQLAAFLEQIKPDIVTAP